MSTPIEELPEITVTAQSLVRSHGRRPRALIRLGTYPGVIVPGWISWSVSNNSYYEADTFRITFAAKRLPAAYNANWFSTQKEVFAEILAGFPQDPTNPQPAELTSLIYGRIDNINLNPRDGLITVTGRDLTAAFIDNKIADTFPGKTASDIAIKIANNRGITPQVVATGTNVGAYYNNDQVSLTANTSEWDLLCLLARDEGFVCFVSGQSPSNGAPALYFEPDPRNSANPYVIQWVPNSNGTPQANVKGITFDRSLTVAKGITVTAISPSTSRKTPVKQSYPSSPKSIGAGKSSPFGTTQPYLFYLEPNLTPVQVQTIAKKKYDDIISHEMKMTAHLPATDSVGISAAISVQGTGTAFDQTYFPRLITREMDIDGGYNMTVEAQSNSGDITPQT